MSGFDLFPTPYSIKGSRVPLKLVSFRLVLSLTELCLLKPVGDNCEQVSRIIAF